jgi:hypothetical protein
MYCTRYVLKQHHHFKYIFEKTQFTCFPTEIPIAFHVWSLKLLSARKKVHFNYTSLDCGNGFNFSQEIFVTPVNGVYWMHFDVISELNTYVAIYELRAQAPGNTNQSTEVLARANAQASGGGDILSGDVMQQLSRGTKCFAMYSYAGDYGRLTTVHGASYAQPAAVWNGFLLNADVSSSRTMFSVRRYDSYAINRSAGSGALLLTFPTVLLNNGRGWNTTGSQFQAPVAGIYVFSFSAHFCLSAVFDTVMLKVKTKSATLPFPLMRIRATGMSTLSRTVVVNVTANDLVYTEVGESTIQVCASQDNPVTLMGFHYSPPQAAHIVAWSVPISRMTSNGIRYRRRLESADVKAGAAWNDTENKVTVPIAGIYYVVLTVTHDLFNNDKNLEAQLLLNNITLCKIVSLRPELETKERAQLLSLQFNDVLSVNFVYGTLSYNNINNNFAGFLVYPQT